MRTQVRHFINGHKALVEPVTVGLMAHYSEWGVTAFIYLALHGSYSILWLIKDHLFRDRRFDEEIVPAIGLFFVFLPLAGMACATTVVGLVREEHARQGQVHLSLPRIRVLPAAVGAVGAPDVAPG